MSLVVIGLSHRCVPLDILERMTIDVSGLGKALDDLIGRTHLSEAVILSTCNRTEIYAVSEEFHGAYSEILDFLSETSYLPVESFSEHLYVHHDDDVAGHLFRVTAGLDSAVVGEAEILGQVRNAWRLSQAEGAVGPTLNMLFRHAIEVGKRARSETGTGRHVASVSTAAVAMARKRLGELPHRRILVVGAGDLGEGMVRALASEGVAELRVANRTWERAVELANLVEGRAIRMAELPAALEEVDLLFTCTGASSMLLEHADLERAMDTRGGRGLLVVDVAVPRDVDPSAAGIDGVTLLDMEDLRVFSQESVDQQCCEIDAVTTILAEELDRFVATSLAREVAPLIASFHDRAETVRLAELERHKGRLGDLEESQIEAIEALTRGLVAKLVHQPTLTVKGAVGTPRGERLAEALRELFDLD